MRGQPMYVVATEDLSQQDVRDLLAQHLKGMHQTSPPGHVFALDLSGLQQPDITFMTVREAGHLLGIGALRAVSPKLGELKSMRTHPDHLRRGVAAALLDHMIAEGRRRGYERLSLETGSGTAFDAAIALYRSRGFTSGDAFGGYTKSAFNQFFHLSLN